MEPEHVDALEAACASKSRNCADIVALLIQHGAKVRVTKSSAGMSHLEIAVLQHNPQVFRFLVEAGANPNEMVFDRNGWRPLLHFADGPEKIELVRLGADPAIGGN